MGNLLLVFHFSIRSRRRSCGNVGISPVFGEISKGLVERGGSLLLAFHAFHRPGIPTALSFSDQILDSHRYLSSGDYIGYSGPGCLFFLLFFNR